MPRKQILTKTIRTGSISFQTNKEIGIHVRALCMNSHNGIQCNEHARRSDNIAIFLLFSQ